MSPLYTPTRDLALPTALVRETVITSLSPGAVLDHEGLHNIFRGMEPDPRAITRLHDCLEARDAANELPDGSMPGGRILLEPAPPPKRRRRQAIVRPPHFWDESKITAAFQQWVAVYGQPPISMDWDPGTARRVGRPEVAERFEAGDWPHRMAVQDMFGTWRHGMRVALGVDIPRGRPLRVAS